MPKIYKMREAIPEGHHVHTDFAHLPELVKHILYHRGIRTASEADIFLNPDYIRDTHDPFLMKDMEEAVVRILSAIDANEKIVIYSDYDADGIPAAVVMSDFFNKINYKNFSVYIPHRHDEGFGLNADALEKCAKDGAKLLVTLDCGIADSAEVKHANTLGLDVIITDHHNPGTELPPAFAILDAKQEGDMYPEKMLCGSGVAFKLVQALLARRRGQWGIKEGWEKWLLDMVGLATMADMVPLRGENRVFARFGLMVLRKSPRVGLQALLSGAGASQTMLSEDDIGFTIAPRINAASRMGVPDDAFKLLATTDLSEAGMLAEHLEAINVERKGLIASMVKEMKHTIRGRYPTGVPSVLVMGNPDWRPALLGLAANTLAEEYCCPVFLWGRDGGGVLKGSCRSDGETNLYTLMHEVEKGIFLEFGGHAFSGGFAVPQDKVHLLEEALIQARTKLPAKGAVTEEELVDAVVTPEDITPKLYDLIERIGPFGVNNPKPLFLLENVSILSSSKFGKTNNHLKIIIPRTKGGPLTAIQFFTDADTYAKAEGAKTLSLVATLEKSSFRGRVEFRLRIVDIF